MSVCGWMRRKRLWAVLAAGILLAAVGYRASGRADAQGKWIYPQRDEAANVVQADGALQPYGVTQITAPFDGKILKKFVQVGDWVEASAPLLEMDRQDVMVEWRDAEVARTRAAETLRELKNWKQAAPEVLAAQRQLQRAMSSMELAQRKFNETRALYDKGIVARTELDASEIEFANAKAEHSTAQESLQAALKKGDANQVKAATLEYQNRAVKFDQLDAKVKHATVRAPNAGIVLYPVQDGPAAISQVKEFNPGAFASGKEVLLSLGDVSQYRVTSSLDEMDIAKVRVGMPVEVVLSGNGQVVLKGVLERISAQAKRDSQMSMAASAPMFEIQVAIRDVPAAQRSRIRLGMSAHLRISAPRPASLTIPIEAVHQEGERRYVWVADGAGRSAKHWVILGETQLDRVVVLSGLDAQTAVWVKQEQQADALRGTLFGMFGNGDGHE